MDDEREIKKMINQKRKAWKHFKSDGGQENREKYEDLTKKLKKTILKAKRKQEKDLAFSKDKN
jgi:hypothetical protein